MHVHKAQSTQTTSTLLSVMVLYVYRIIEGRGGYSSKFGWMVFYVDTREEVKDV